jgi:hypothetical protein
MRCHVCKGPIQAVSSTLSICPRCASQPVKPIEFRPAPPSLKTPRYWYGGPQRPKGGR